jgi:hypothetical protein
LRVTVVATGLGKAVAKKAPVTVLRTVSESSSAVVGSTSPGPHHDYAHLDSPAVWRSRDGAAVRQAVAEEAAERFEIPAFLRKQAD